MFPYFFQFFGTDLKETYVASPPRVARSHSRAPRARMVKYGALLRRSMPNLDYVAPHLVCTAPHCTARRGSDGQHFLFARRVTFALSRRSQATFDETKTASIPLKPADAEHPSPRVVVAIVSRLLSKWAALAGHAPSWRPIQ
jgi:hypothetical protein